MYPCKEGLPGAVCVILTGPSNQMRVHTQTQIHTSAQDARGKDVDDLMMLSAGSGQARILLSQRDAIKGCGVWRDASVAPVRDIASGHVSYLVSLEARTDRVH